MVLIIVKVLLLIIKSNSDLFSVLSNGIALKKKLAHYIKHEHLIEPLKIFFNSFKFFFFFGYSRSIVSCVIDKTAGMNGCEWIVFTQ